MSATPRTDEWVRLFNSNAPSAPSAADFACQLERELNAAVLCAGVAAKERGEWAAERERLEKELKRAKASLATLAGVVTERDQLLSDLVSLREDRRALEQERAYLEAELARR